MIISVTYRGNYDDLYNNQIYMRVNVRTPAHESELIRSLYASICY